MASEAYEILSLTMRYVFVLLLLLIVIRSYFWLLKEHRAHQKVIRSLPDAGLVGEIVMLETGRAYPLPREGTIGSARSCDITVKGDGIRRVHATLRFIEGKGLSVIAHHGCDVMLNGEALTAYSYALHGSTILLGACPLRVRLFAGLHVPHTNIYAPDEAQIASDDDEFLPEDSFIPEDESQMTWAYAPYPPELLRQMAAEQEIYSAQQMPQEAQDASFDMDDPFQGASVNPDIEREDDEGRTEE